MNKEQSMFTFAHPRGGEPYRVSRNLWGNFRLMQRRPDLVAKGRYTIRSDVDREVVDLFFARVMGEETAVATAENAEQLRALCDELDFAFHFEKTSRTRGSATTSSGGA